MAYACEQCGAQQTCSVGFRNDGMCATCGLPMRIEDLFSDRRIISLPVTDERRELTGGSAA